MIGTVWEVQFTDEDFHIDSNQLLYEECLERTRGLKKEELEKELEEKQHPRLTTTSSGRILN